MNENSTYSQCVNILYCVLHLDWSAPTWLVVLNKLFTSLRLFSHDCFILGLLQDDDDFFFGGGRNVPPPSLWTTLNQNHFGLSNTVLSYHAGGQASFLRNLKLGNIKHINPDVAKL